MEAQVAQLSGEISTFLEATLAWAAVALPNFIGAVVLLVVGWWIAARARRAVRAMLDRQSRIDAMLSSVIASLVRYAILVVVIMAVLGQLGIETTSILAALGAIGLAIGLALQGTLSNIAAGLMLLWLRPFKVGDYIDTGGVAGTVKEVGLFASELHSWDGIFQFVPNSELWNKRIVNYSRLQTRLVDLAFGVSYEDDIGKGRETLLKIAGEDERVRKEPEATVFVDELGDSAVVLRLRVWSMTDNYWDVRRALTKSGKAALEAAGLSIPFPQRDLHIKDGPDRLTGKAA